MLTPLLAGAQSASSSDYCNGATDDFQPVHHGFYWTWENDAVGVVKSDSYYTQGAQVGYTIKYNRDPGFLARTASHLCKLVGFKANGEQGSKVLSAGSFFIGQQLFTPKDTDVNTPIPDDRPYAGWAYAGTRLELLQPLKLSEDGRRRWVTHSFEFQAGVVGRHAQGEGTQRAFHDLDGSNQSNGWDNQISDRFGGQAYYTFSTRLFSFDIGNCCQGANTDVLFHGALGAGTLQTHAEVGAVWRIGRNMGPMAQRTVVPSALSATMQPLKAVETQQAFQPNMDTKECSFLFRAKECYVFVAAAARAVDKNIFVEPAASGAGRDIDLEAYVYELSWGARVRYRWARFDYISTTRSREFSPAPANPLERRGRHDYGSLTMSCYGAFDGYGGEWEWVCPGFVAALTGFLVLR